MNVAPEANHPRAWIARVGDQADNPTTLGEAKGTSRADGQGTAG
jgi:hypothetical protein